MSDSPARIDVRAPRFGAWITSALLAITIVLTLVDTPPAVIATFGWFGYRPLAATTDFAYVARNFIYLGSGFWALLIVTLLFLWGVLSPKTAPWGVLFRTVVLPRISPTSETEDARPPRFAQGVGLFVTAAGLVLHLLGVPYALTIAAAFAFVAAFLNAAFGVCLGCMMYLGIPRVRPSRTA